MKEEKIEVSLNEEDVQNLVNCYEKDIKYIKQLETNWKELKKWLEEENSKTFIDIVSISAYEKVLNKMQKIESGTNE